MPFRISLIGHDRHTLEAVARSLTQKGHVCALSDEAGISAGALALQSPDIVLVENDSAARIAELSQEIKDNIEVPVVALVRGAALGRTNGHFNQVDDFVASPFHADELDLRITRLLRRTAANAGEDLSCGELQIDTARCEVSVAGREVVLTFKEYELLKFLVANQGRVCTRDVLLDKVWGHDYYGGDRTVDVHIRRLRSKIEDAGHTFIETVRNIGYRLRVCV
jgi:DNA-binding response OmpR family regulator